MNIEIKAVFPIAWDRDYFTVECKEKRTFAPCVACDNTGKITIKGEEYTCPRCRGNWREKEVTGTTLVYSVGKWRLSCIEIGSPSCNFQKIVLSFQRTNGETNGGCNNVLRVREAWFDTMEIESYGNTCKLYDDYKAALAEVKRLNAAQKESENENGND